MDRHIPASLREQKSIKRCPVEVQMWRQNVPTPSEVYSDSDCTVHMHKHSHANTLAQPSQGPARSGPSGSPQTPVSALSKEAPSVAATGTRSFLQPGSCPDPAEEPDVIAEEYPSPLCCGRELTSHELRVQRPKEKPIYFLVQKTWTEWMEEKVSQWKVSVRKQTSEGTLIS